MSIQPFAMTAAGDVILKRLTLGSVLATGAGTAIPVTVVSSVNATSTTEWASFAARYQEYRVRAIRVRGKAVNPVQTATITHSILYRGDFLAANTPATAAQVLSDENVQETCTCKDFEHVVTWVGNPNAKLWTATTIAIPTANLFNWVCVSPAAPALTTATTYYAVSQEFEVEFRGSQ
jgi:hypothetical protein